MKLSEIDYKGKLSVYQDLDLDLTPEDQIWSLNEDLMYVTYDNGLSLDIGWHREFEANGLFNIYIIENGNWDTPMHFEKIGYKDFITRINSFISFCKNFTPIERSL